MKLNMQKRLASNILNAGKKRIIFDSEKLSDIKEAITKEDIREMVKMGLIKVRNKKGISKLRHRKILKQKRKGRRQGPGSRRGKSGARLNKKRFWINKVRIQRLFLRNLKLKKIILSIDYRKVYMKIKGGF